MSKRSDILKGMFVVEPATVADVPPTTQPKARVPSGAVKSMGVALGSVEQENEQLRQMMAAGAHVVELDPAQCIPSPIRDRFDSEGSEAFEELKASIESSGQEVPILVRPYGNGYQVAYGHRRLRAVAALGLKVKAIVKPLTDAQLIVAQGLENSARQDLSWIEQAVFAAALEHAGHDRQTIMEALSRDKAEISRMISLVETVPSDVLRAIGAAPKTGRPRWLALASIVTERLPAIREVLASDDFKSMGSDARIASLLATANTSAVRAPRTIKLTDRISATVSVGARAAKLAVDDPRFGAWLIDKLPDLVKSFEENHGPK